MHKVFLFYVFKKHAQRITEVAAWRCFWFFLNSKNFLTEHHYYLFSKILVLQKSHYGPRNKVNMVMFLLINASRDIHFFFFYITWTKLAVSFQSQNSHNRASQISMNFRNPKSIFHLNTNTHPSNIYLLVQNDIFVIFSAFKQHFQFLANKMSCLETFHVRGKKL